MGMESFYTSDRASEGNKVPLSLPDGTPTEEFLIIRGTDSDEFRLQESMSKRKAFQISLIEDELKREEAYRHEENLTVASLVAGWSFDEECTTEAVVELFKKAPQLRDMVNSYAGKRQNFFPKESEDS